MTWLTSGGLRYACAKHSGQSDPQTYYQQKVTEGKQKRVIIVGAGMAGLSAAYEMAQIGHKVDKCLFKSLFFFLFKNGNMKNTQIHHS